MRTGWPASPGPTSGSRPRATRAHLVVAAFVGVTLASGCSMAGSSGTAALDAVRGEAESIVERLVAGEAPAVRTMRLRPRPQPGPFSMDLYRDGDFVGQQTTAWCIPSATQTMMNIIDPGPPDRSTSLQRRFYRLGDRLNEDGTRAADWEPDDLRGMSISEWVGLLNHFDYGPYELAGMGTLRGALRESARAMRLTRKPVGLVIWRGAHAWVMSGFSATADPALTDDFEVTAVRVQDPWFPRVSSTWGPSKPPGRNVSASALGDDFLRFDRPGRRHPLYDGRYMLVLPRVTPGTVVE